MDSHNLTTIKQLWDTFARDGQGAATEALLAACHPDAEFRPYTADGKLLHGCDEIREFFAQAAASGDTLKATPYSFSEEGDVVTVGASIRVIHGDGSLADAQVAYTYRFRDGRIARAATAPVSAASG